MIIRKSSFEILHVKHQNLAIVANAEIVLACSLVGSTPRHPNISGIDVKFLGFENLIIEIRSKSIVLPIAFPKAKQIALCIPMLFRLVFHINVWLVREVVGREFVSLRSTVTRESQPLLL